MNEWKPVKGYEGLYEINKLGCIKSLQKRNYNNTLSTRVDRAGYRSTRLCKNGKVIGKFIHRLLAETYIPNPENKKFVNHLNGDKLDNRIENLEWVTHSENMLHAYKIGLIKINSKSIVDHCTGKLFNGIKEASNFMGINRSTLKGYLSGKRTNPTCLRYLNSIAA